MNLQKKERKKASFKAENKDSKKIINHKEKLSIVFDTEKKTTRNSRDRDITSFHRRLTIGNKLYKEQKKTLADVTCKLHDDECSD